MQFAIGQIKKDKSVDYILQCKLFGAFYRCMQFGIGQNVFINISF
jgi:hypothetical protein